MRVVILAAGQSQRFQDAGYKKPKQFLDINWRGAIYPMLWHALFTVPLDLDITVMVSQDYKVYLKEQAYWANIRFVSLDCKTTGPAHTAEFAMQEIGFNENTVFMDCDVLNHTNDIKVMSLLASNGVLVYPSNNPNYSYVNEIGDFTSIKEKECISEWAVRGAYSFSRHNMEEFKEVLGQVVSEINEPYLSHVLDRMSSNKVAFRALYPPVDWGTPDAIVNSGAKIMGD